MSSEQIRYSAGWLMRHKMFSGGIGSVKFWIVQIFGREIFFVGESPLFHLSDII